MTSKLRILVTGLIAQHPTLPGVAWDYLQYPLGLARLGHDVVYLEDSGQWAYNLDGGPTGDDWVARDPAANVDHLERVMARFGLAGRWAYRFAVDGRWYGLPDREREAAIASADLLINVSGTLEHPREYRRVPVLAYVDSDPGFTQVKLAQGEQDFRTRVDAHDVHFSFGECLDRVPDTGHRWLPTRQPIVLSEWRPGKPARSVYTTVMSWTSYKPLSYRGRTYGQKDVELLRFLDLPARVRPELELTLGALHHSSWQTDLASFPEAARAFLQGRDGWRPEELLAHMGWRVVDAARACPDLDAYRRYIASSRGEWSVAKNGYVAGRTGWFSCRSACYLAAGRPVVVQDTGFSPVLPADEGIVAFSTPEEAADAIAAVEADYPRHARRAREIAEEYFDSDRVLSRLTEEAISTSYRTAEVEG